MSQSCTYRDHPVDAEIVDRLHDKARARVVKHLLESGLSWAQAHEASSRLPRRATLVGESLLYAVKENA